MQAISTPDAPKAIGAYSQAVKHGNMVFLSGQIPLTPDTMKLASLEINEQIHQVFKNLLAVIRASGGAPHDVVKLNVYLTDLDNFSLLNDIMANYFTQPYPARAAVEVNRLPKNSQVEIDGIMIINP